MSADKRKRARITPNQQHMIMTWALEEPRLPRHDLALKLQSQFSVMQLPVPELAVLERKISRYRTQVSSSPLDAPWVIQTLGEHPISAEGLPIVLEAWVYARSVLGHVFTIRDAMWVDRLRVLCQGEGISGITFEAMRFAKEETQKKLMPTAGAFGPAKDIESENLFLTLKFYEKHLKAPLSKEKSDAILFPKMDRRAESLFPDASNNSNTQPSRGIPQPEEWRETK